MMGNSVPLPEDLREFVNGAQWTFAKTYAATWPHEYIVRKRVDEALFIGLVTHIRVHGYEGMFYRLTITYFDEGDHVYWTMGEPIDETEIVNRCRWDQTYEYRLAHDLLPEQQKETPNDELEVQRTMAGSLNLTADVSPKRFPPRHSARRFFLPRSTR